MGRPSTFTQETSIYALLCPDTRAVRYIGKANDPARRLKTHIRDARRRRTPVYLWLRRLHAEGKAPILEIIETCPPADWPARERHWIETYRQREDGLMLNRAEGGDEPYCPPEVRAANAAGLNARLRADPKLQRLRLLKAKMMMYLRECRESAAAEPERLERHLERLRRLGRARPHVCGEWANIS